MTRDVEILGQMDPYCSFTINNQQYKTGVQQDQGKNPIWNRRFVFEYVDKLEIKVMDS